MKQKSDDKDSGNNKLHKEDMKDSMKTSYDAYCFWIG